MLGVDLVGSRRIWPAQVGWLVGLDGSRRIQTDRVDDHGASDRKPDGKASSFREASGTPDRVNRLTAGPRPSRLVLGQLPLELAPPFHPRALTELLQLEQLTELDLPFSLGLTTGRKREPLGPFHGLPHRHHPKNPVDGDDRPWPRRRGRRSRYARRWRTCPERPRRSNAAPPGPG